MLKGQALAGLGASGTRDRTMTRLLVASPDYGSPTHAGGGARHAGLSSPTAIAAVMSGSEVMEIEPIGRPATGRVGGSERGPVRHAAGGLRLSILGQRRGSAAPLTPTMEPISTPTALEVARSLASDPPPVLDLGNAWDLGNVSEADEARPALRRPAAAAASVPASRRTITAAHAPARASKLRQSAAAW